MLVLRHDYEGVLEVRLACLLLGDPDVVEGAAAHAARQVSVELLRC